MGLLKSAFNASCRLHSRAVTLKRLTGSPNTALYSPARATPSNYFRSLSGPAETVVTGSEFIIPVSSLTGTQVQLLSFSVTPTTGTWKLTYNSLNTTDLNFDAIAADVQVALRLISGLENSTVTGNYLLGFSVAMFGPAAPLLMTSSITGLDAVITITIPAVGVLFSPIIQRGDRMLDGSKSVTVKEIIEMPDLGGDVMGYRVRVE